MAYLGYLSFRGLVLIFALLPFKALYLVSDFISWLLYTVLGYRKKVVFQQLKASFPNRTDEEITEIAIASYHNLADVIVESIKGFTMRESTFRKRYKFVNPELAAKNNEIGRSSIHIAAHYGNWEWGAMTYPLWFPSPVLGFYKPLSNKYIEAYCRRKRGRFNMDLIPIGQTAQAFESHKVEAVTYVFMSDQSTWSDKAHWVTFLGQDTACPPGADKYARLLKCPVYYIDIQRVKRGYYEIKLSTISDGNEVIQEGEITERFMRHLENILLEKPGNWLWSHKRWKKKREVEG